MVLSNWFQSEAQTTRVIFWPIQTASIMMATKKKTGPSTFDVVSMLMLLTLFIVGAVVALEVVIKTSVCQVGVLA